jgi:Zn ribbon nucleic-acid-binding protein
MERLTSVEVANADIEDDAVLVRQCLICGYTEQRPVESADRSRPAPA